MRRARLTDSTVLYDALGPRGRRRARTVTVALTLVFLGALGYIGYRIGEFGQLEYPRWSYVTDPVILRQLGFHMVNNLKIAGIAGGITLVVGLFLALGRMSRFRLISVPSVAWIEFFRGFPAILLIIFPSLIFPVYFRQIPAIWYVVIGLTLYNSAVMAEIYRTGVRSLEHGQTEAARAIGLRYGQVMRLVVLPQAIRRMTPLLLTQLIILFKDSTLGYVVSYEEVLRRSQTIGSARPQVIFQVTIVAAVMFFLASFILSRLVAYIEYRQARKYAGSTAPAPAEVAELEITGAA